MKTSHTPGPWKWIGSRQSPQERIYLSAPEGYVDWTDLRSPEAQANARLIAAAPELLETAAELLRAYDAQYGKLIAGSTVFADAYLAMRNVIAKATQP